MRLLTERHARHWANAASLKAPYLIAAWTKSKRRERDRAFSDPAVLESSHRHLPHGIPVAVVQAFVGKLTLVPAAGGRNAELDAVASIVKRVEHERDVLTEPSR
jgi:hypothetical protein